MECALGLSLDFCGEEEREDKALGENVKVFFLTWRLN